MTAADSLYQTVRSHLAYLNLGAAAEALPGQLDDARKAKATHTEFLERLLAIEVEATEARRLTGRLRFVRLPRFGGRVGYAAMPSWRRYQLVSNSTGVE